MSRDSDLDALFEAERSFEESPTAEARARIHDGVLATIGIPVPSGGGIPVGRAALGMLGTFVIGGAVGAAVMHRSMSFPPSNVVEVAPSPSVAPSATTSIELPSATPSASSAPLTPRRAVPVPAPSSSESSEEAVAAERALLDAARIAIANGQPQNAVDLVERHAREFPRGRLVEEREALAVRALVKASRYEEARKRGIAFKATWPLSLAMPAVNAALESIP